MTETPESIAALRRYFDGHEAALSSITGESFAAAMAQANKAAVELRNLSAAQKEAE